MNTEEKSYNIYTKYFTEVFKRSRNVNGGGGGLWAKEEIGRRNKTQTWNFQGDEGSSRVVWDVTPCSDVVGYQRFEWRQQGPSKAPITSLHYVITRKTMTRKKEVGLFHDAEKETKVTSSNLATVSRIRLVSDES
jgi:hypothetical protein